MTEEDEKEEPQFEEQNEEEAKDAKFISSLIRAPKQGTYEQFLCQLLAQSVICTDPLKRIKIVCEAAETVKESERQKLNIDYERIQVLYINANAFLNPTIRTDSTVDDTVVGLPIPYFPSEENFKKFIAPWYTAAIMNYWSILVEEALKMEVENMDKEWCFFFAAESYLTQLGFNRLKNAFIAWAGPQAQRYLAELTGAVDQNTYREILGLYGRPGRGDYAQKVREAAKQPETRQDEDLVDT